MPEIAPNLKPIYRVEVAPTDSSTTGMPYVFVGSDGELEKLDQELNVGTRVEINDRTTAFSMSLEKVLTPNQIRPQEVPNLHRLN